MEFRELKPGDTERMTAMAAMAAAIWHEHYDTILGREQVDYMIAMFQSCEAIAGQLRQGYRYFFASVGDKPVGFLAIVPRDECMYLSKLYLCADERGKGYARLMVEFVARQARGAGLSRIELNVNRHNDAVAAYEALGFVRIRAEVIDIGNGYVMDDYVYALDV